MKFHGIEIPAGEGLVVEVHVDLIQPSHAFVSFLEGCGFENDPFSVFYPPGYTHHMTGRFRSPEDQLRRALGRTEDSVEEILAAGAKEQGFYIEIELVRDVVHFSGIRIEPVHELTNLEDFQFTATGSYGASKADIHVEFPRGQVIEPVRQYLLSKKFYWVETPPTKYFGPEEIATLQTETYGSAREVYLALCERPLPYCTAVHLEQKIKMVSSRAGLSMPEVIRVER